MKTDRGVLMCLLATWVSAMAAVGCCATAGLPARQYASHDDQAFRALHVEQLCIQIDDSGAMLPEGFEGTGVLVSPNRVLTAAHVANCKVQGLRVTRADGISAYAGLVSIDRQRDVALLSIPDGWLSGDLPLPALGQAVVGEVVCARVAAPARGTTCGEVLSVGGAPGQDVGFGGVIQHGNSGAGVYDSDGRLVGVVTVTHGDHGGGFTSVLPELR